MTLDELLELDDDAQLSFLNGQIDAGKTAEEVMTDMGTNRVDLGRYGFFIVKGRFMLKPTRGYARNQPTKLG